jgi:hypothetical protein
MELQYTSYVEGTDNEIIEHPEGRFYAFLMPGGGWVVKDEKGHYYLMTSDRVADEFVADDIIGDWAEEEWGCARSSY